MIIPDKETEAFLNRNADSRSVAFLCRLRLINPFDALRAAALLRDEDAWRNLFRRAIRGLTLLAVVSGLFFLFLSRWKWTGAAPSCFVLTAALAVCAVLKHKYRFFDVAGALIIGLLIFMTDNMFGVNDPAGRRMLVWTGFLFLWEAASFSVPSFTKTILSANIAVVVLAFQNPFDFFTPVKTAVLLSLLNLTAAAAERFFGKNNEIPVLAAFAALLIPPVVNAASGSAFVPSDLFLAAAPVPLLLHRLFNIRKSFVFGIVLPVFAAVLSVRLKQALPAADHIDRIGSGLVPALTVIALLALKKIPSDHRKAASSRMTIRQMLSCLNVSVFAEKNEAALLAGGQLAPALPDGGDDPDVGRKALIWTGASALLFAFSGTPLTAGAVLTAGGLLLCRFWNKGAVTETILLSGVLILISALAVRSSFTAVVFSGLLLSLAIASLDRNKFVFDTALLFAGTVLFAAGKEHAVAAASLMSVAGTSLFLFPAGRCFWRTAAIVFMLLPPAVFAANEIAFLFGRTVAAASPVFIYAIVAEACLLFAPLYREMSAGERIAGLLCVIAAGACAALFSQGTAACLVLAAVAYFANVPALGKTALRGLFLFIPTGLLQTRLSFDALAAAGLVSAFLLFAPFLQKRRKRHV